MAAPAKRRRQADRRALASPLMLSALLHALAVAALARFATGPPSGGHAAADVELVKQIPAADAKAARAPAPPLENGSDPARRRTSPALQTLAPPRSPGNGAHVVNALQKPPPEPPPGSKGPQRAKSERPSAAPRTPAVAADAKPHVSRGDKQASETPSRSSDDARDADPATAMPFFSMPSSFTSNLLQGQGTSGDSYKGLVFGMIARAKQIPTSVRAQRETGQAVVAFTVSEKGELASLSLAQSSGFPDLDQEAMDMVRRVAPFPPPPPGAIRKFGVAIAFGDQ